jgi:ligand-binding SRPBCC domain-containing protein
MAAKPITIRWDAERRCHELHCSTLSPLPAEETFEFFSDALNLEAMTPPWLQFRVVTPRPIEIYRGALIDYRLKLHGVPFKWRTEITDWNPHHSFMDRQLSGPYRMWEHLHTFREVDGQTLVEDTVRYRVPLGRLVNRFFVEREVRRIFEYRQERLVPLLMEFYGSHTTPESESSQRVHASAAG